MCNATVVQQVQTAVLEAFPPGTNIEFDVLNPGVRDDIESTRIVANVDTVRFAFGNPMPIELDEPVVVIGEPTRILVDVTHRGEFLELELNAQPRRQAESNLGS